MIVVLVSIYIVILVLFIWLKFIPFNTFWKISPLIVLLLLNIGLFIPMGWGAPQGPAAVVRNSVQIVPSVAGEVTEVPVTANTALKSGEVLFRIDPTTYQATVNGLEAQLRLARQRLSEITELQTRGAGRQNEVEQRQSEVDQLKAQLDGAQWNLDKTTVRAPADGYVTNLGLRTGARVTAQSPVMAFIDTSETHSRSRSSPDQRALRQGRPAGRGDVQDFPGRRLHRPRRGSSSGDRKRTGADRRHGGCAR